MWRAVTAMACAFLAALASANARVYPVHANPIAALDERLEHQTTAYMPDDALGPRDRADGDFGRGESETWLSRMHEPPLQYRRSGFVLRLTKMYGAAAETIRIEQRADGTGQALYLYFLGKRTDRRAHVAARSRTSLTRAQMSSLRQFMISGGLDAAPPRADTPTTIVQMDGWAFLAEMNIDGDFHVAFRRMADAPDAVFHTIVFVEMLTSESFKSDD